MARAKVLVSGAGGFIGHHLVSFLKQRDYWVRGVDLKVPEYTPTEADEFEILDLRRWSDCLQATRGVEEVYALAADMGGMGFISAHHARILRNNVLINTQTLEAGDGEQTRSFCYIDDCLEGLYRLMRSDHHEPLNLGQDRMVTINQLADLVAAVAGTRINKKHIDGPQGVRGRNSDNRRLRQVLGWEPQISLEEGLGRTYPWIEQQVRQKYFPAGRRRSLSSKPLTKEGLFSEAGL